jgi:hypothetical protein
MDGVANRMGIGYGVSGVAFRVKNVIHFLCRNHAFTNTYLAEYSWTLFRWCSYPGVPALLKSLSAVHLHYCFMSLVSIFSFLFLVSPEEGRSRELSHSGGSQRPKPGMYVCMR